MKEYLNFTKQLRVWLKIRYDSIVLICPGVDLCDRCWTRQMREISDIVCLELVILSCLVNVQPDELPGMVLFA